MKAQKGGFIIERNTAISAICTAGADTPYVTVGNVIYAAEAGTAGILARDCTADVEVGMRTTSIGGIIGTHTNHALLFRTNDGTRMTIGNNGNVGIGTTSPGAKLQVNGVGRFTDGTASTYIDVYGDTSSARIGQNANSGLPVSLYGAGSVQVNIDSNNNETIHTFSVRKDAVQGGTELFRVQEDGKVGIGTTSPGAVLDIENPTTNTAALKISPAGDSHSYFYLDRHDGKDGGILLTEDDVLDYQITATNDRGFNIYSYSLGNVAFRIAPTTGNVGIGTTGPTHKLEVVGSTTWDNTAKFVSTGSSSGIELYTSTSTRNGLLYGTGGDFGLLSSDTSWGVRISDTDAQIYHPLTLDSNLTVSGTISEAGTALSSKYMGISTDNWVNTSGDTMTGELFIEYDDPRITFTGSSATWAGYVHFNDDGNNSYLLCARNGVTSSGGTAGALFTYVDSATRDFQHVVAGTSVFIIKGSGDVGIGPDTTPDYMLDVQGTFRADSTASFGDTVTAPTFSGALSGNATTATSASTAVRQPSSGNYVWLAATTAANLPGGITNSFVAAAEGFPSYGTVINARSYSGGGGGLQIYAPYGSGYGGSSMQYRLADYNAGTSDPPWTAWKTVIDSATIGSQSVNYATTAARATRANGDFYIDDNYGNSVIGVYSATRYQGVYSMGNAYKLAADGTSPGGLYGLAWTHTNIGGESKAGLSHQLLIMHAGVTKTALGTGIWTAGNCTIGGSISKGSGSFLIDHPLDPANKVLRHSFVESPDMKNIYDGVVTLDDNGETTVKLPDYFEALNKDFRYQLTPIGASSILFVKEEIKDNKFVISGGKPGMKVSWQVTGTRIDAFALEHPVIVEEDKGPVEMDTGGGVVPKKGKYVHPASFGIVEEPGA